MAADANTVYKLTTRVVENLQLGDVTKINSFFGKIVREYESTIAANKQSKESAKLASEGEINKLENALVDAKEIYEASFVQIDLEAIATMTSQQAYVEKYMGQITAAGDAIKAIEAQIAAEKEKLKSYLADCDNKIKICKERIDLIK